MTGIKAKEVSINEIMTGIMKDIHMKDQVMTDQLMIDIRMKRLFKILFIKIKVFLMLIIIIVKINIPVLIKIKCTIKMLKTIIELNFSWK